MLAPVVAAITVSVVFTLVDGYVDKHRDASDLLTAVSGEVVTEQLEVSEVGSGSVPLAEAQSSQKAIRDRIDRGLERLDRLKIEPDAHKAVEDVLKPYHRAVDQEFGCTRPGSRPRAGALTSNRSTRLTSALPAN
ncbi:MAG: hypothetical protein ACR2MY_06745 [Candidatus Dormibacteria bacterium]